ncbi:MAG: hypothetical protein NXI30_12640 [bacterium]|nr:hypothetical protein [bacterium]
MQAWKLINPDLPGVPGPPIPPAWDIPPQLLQPARTNTDAIHGDIATTGLEQLIIDSPGFQRLRGLRQLGTAHLVYPGATHTRFQHSLGALHVVQELYEEALDSRGSREARDDLFFEWAQAGPTYAANHIARSLVLARLGALLHDYCHVPYGHTIEDDAELAVRHDANGPRFEDLWERLGPKVHAAIKPPLLRELRHLVLSKEQTAEGAEPFGSEYPFVADLVGNTISADLIDYLWRDYYYTGLPAGFGRRLFSSFMVTQSDNPDYPKRVALRIYKDDRYRADVTTEVLKYLRYRYELGERVLNHHAKVAADCMLERAISIWIHETSPEAVEQQLRKLGDDALLDNLSASKFPAVAELASGVRERKLYKSKYRTSGVEELIRADQIFARYRTSAARAEVERTAARYAQIPAHYVLLSVPDPAMRLKAAGVLVQAKGSVVPLKNWDAHHGAHAAEILRSHRELWSIQLYTHPDLTDHQREIVAASVADIMHIEWFGPTAAEIGSHRIHLAARDAALENDLTLEDHQRMIDTQHREDLNVATHEDLKRSMVDALSEHAPMSEQDDDLPDSDDGDDEDDPGQGSMF